MTLNNRDGGGVVTRKGSGVDQKGGGHRKLKKRRGTFTCEYLQQGNGKELRIFYASGDENPVLL